MTQFKIDEKKYRQLLKDHSGETQTKRTSSEKQVVGAVGYKDQHFDTLSRHPQYIKAIADEKALKELEKEPQVKKFIALENSGDSADPDKIDQKLSELGGDPDVKLYLRSRKAATTMSKFLALHNPEYKRLKKKMNNSSNPTKLLAKLRELEDHYRDNANIK